MSTTDTDLRGPALEVGHRYSYRYTAGGGGTIMGTAYYQADGTMATHKEGGAIVIPAAMLDGLRLGGMRPYHLKGECKGCGTVPARNRRS